MKDKRNCGANMYPIYQAPIMVPPFPMGVQPNYQGYQSYPSSNLSTNTIEQQINNLEQQVNLLDQRVTRLEKMNNTTTNNYSKYSDSSYYMV